MTDLQELMACPFCGLPGEIVGRAEDGFFSRCTSRSGCYAEVGENYDGSAMPCHMFGSESEADAAWNTRSPAFAEMARVYEAWKGSADCNLWATHDGLMVEPRDDASDDRLNDLQNGRVYIIDAAALAGGDRG